MHKGPATETSELTTSLFDNAQIRGLMKGNESLPSYIHSADFARAVIEVIAAKATTPGVNKLADFVAGLNAHIDKWKTGHPKKSLPPVLEIFKGIAAAATRMYNLEAQFEDWYNRYMPRESACYPPPV